jgi:hypothetical protein
LSKEVYVGRLKAVPPIYEVFLTEEHPPIGRYIWPYTTVFGPFVSMTGARMMAAHGGDSLPLLSPADADAMATNGHTCGHCHATAFAAMGGWRWRQIPIVDRHANAAWMGAPMCHDEDGDGLCDECAVGMLACPVCESAGYHRDGCPLMVHAR